jgi:hypothetical protein
LTSIEFHSGPYCMIWGKLVPIESTTMLFPSPIFNWFKPYFEQFSKISLLFLFKIHELVNSYKRYAVKPVLFLKQKKKQPKTKSSWTPKLRLQIKTYDIDNGLKYRQKDSLYSEKTVIALFWKKKRSFYYHIAFQIIYTRCIFFFFFFCWPRKAWVIKLKIEML